MEKASGTAQTGVVNDRDGGAVDRVLRSDLVELLREKVDIAINAVGRRRETRGQPRVQKVPRRDPRDAEHRDLRRLEPSLLSIDEKPNTTLLGLSSNLTKTIVKLEKVLLVLGRELGRLGEEG